MRRPLKINTGMLPLRAMANANKGSPPLNKLTVECAFAALPCKFEHSETQYWLAHSTAHLYNDGAGSIGLVPFPFRFNKCLLCDAALDASSTHNLWRALLYHVHDLHRSAFHDPRHEDVGRTVYASIRDAGVISGEHYDRITKSCGWTVS